MTKPGRDLSSTRAWLLYALGRVTSGDSEAMRLLERHLDPQNEPDRWVRYWVLSGAARAGTPDAVTLARRAVGDEEPQVRMAGVAILAAAGDEASLNEIRGALKNRDEDVQWPALRALRVVSIDDEIVVQSLIDIIDEGANSDVTYDAIRALRHISQDSRFARDAARSLATFVERWRTFAGRDSMRSQALIGLGKLKVEATAPVLVEEMIDYNPAIVREAARSLEVILGPRTAVARVLEAGSKIDRSYLSAYARALSWMEDREAVASELASAMSAKDVKQQEVGRALLNEVGGVAALEKLRAQNNLMLQHSEFIKESEEKTQQMFMQSMVDARSGFTVSMWMDVVVFALGIGLIGVSAALQLTNKGSLDGWVGTATTGVAGVLGVLYSLFVGKPRQRVEQAVDHVMQLKIVFLGYLRQLHQADQAYIRRLIEDEPMKTAELQEFASIIDANMKAATAQLKRVGEGQAGAADAAGTH
jgi:HEAT repeat protein